MKKTSKCISSVLLFILCVLQAGAQYSPTFDKAYSMGKGAFELAPVFSVNQFSGEGYDFDALGAGGIRIGFGVAKNFDIKMRYERLFYFEEGSGGMNILQLEPKVSFAKEKLAFRLPLQLWFEEGEEEFIINPQVLYTYLNKKKTVDITPGVRLDMDFAEDGEVYTNLGFTLGAGLSKDLTKWAIRPEIGYSFDPEESSGIGLWFYGLAVCINLQPKSK